MKTQPNFSPKKHLGQRFLIDPQVTAKIISACQLKPEDTVLEIGPGSGVLTRWIAPRVKRVIAVETDQRFFEKLKEETLKTNIEVIHADFLKYDLGLLQSVKKLKVIGNLPYYISSPIITRLLNARQYFSSIFITVQLEFGRRLGAKVDTKDYSALSCFVQYCADVKMLFKIKGAAFKPVPKVDSCFMRIIPHEKFPFIDLCTTTTNIGKEKVSKANDEELLFKIIQQAFQQRRKTLPNTLSGLIERERLYPILESLKIDPKSRPENLSVKDFVELANNVLPALKPVPR